MRPAKTWHHVNSYSVIQFVDLSIHTEQYWESGDFGKQMAANLYGTVILLKMSAWDKHEYSLAVQRCKDKGRPFIEYMGPIPIPPHVAEEAKLLAALKGITEK